VSTFRQQALIDAPLDAIWDLVGDPAHHPDWWPRVIEVNGERFSEGATYIQKTKGAMGMQTTSILIERLEDAREVRMRCQDTGTYCAWVLTEAQGSTFVDVEFGMEPTALPLRMWDATLGRRYFRRWLEESLEALDQATKTPA